MDNPKMSVTYGFRAVTISGPDGGCSLDLVELHHCSSACAKERCGLVARATGVSLWEVMKCWSEGSKRRIEAIGARHREVVH